jgi:hypothetical protein
VTNYVRRPFTGVLPGVRRGGSTIGDDTCGGTSSSSTLDDALDGVRNCCVVLVAVVDDGVNGVVGTDDGGRATPGVVVVVGGGEAEEGLTGVVDARLESLVGTAAAVDVDGAREAAALVGRPFAVLTLVEVDALDDDGVGLSKKSASKSSRTIGGRSLTSTDYHHSTTT